MQIIIVNWRLGENDPFTPVNECFAEHFRRLGREVSIVDFDDDFFTNLYLEHEAGIDFAISLQGLSVAAYAEGAELPIWDELKVPMIALHGDHPTHQTVHHQGCAWATHTYGAPSHARFANQHFRKRQRPALQLSLPLQTRPAQGYRFEGDYFVLPKNYDDHLPLFDVWRERYPSQYGQFLIGTAEAIIDQVNSDAWFDHHVLINEAFERQDPQALLAGFEEPEDLVAYHATAHLLLDKIYRNAVSLRLIEQLADVPLKIYGRGWDRIAARANPHHSFAPFERLADGDFQFFSNYGILDVPPAYDGLHDRTLRAIVNRGSFLIASRWPYQSFFPGQHDDVFVNVGGEGLRARVDDIMHKPENHRARCIAFGDEYQRSHSHAGFLRYLEQLAAQIRSQQA